MGRTGWIWKPLVAGLSGSLVHFFFMYLKSRTGLLPSFQPYQGLQQTLAQWVGRDVPAIVPWLLSLVNGMAILGFLFGRISGLLPGRTGLFKGVIFGLIGWILMGLIFFPNRTWPICLSSWIGYCTSAVIAGHAADLQRRVGHGVRRLG